MAEEIGLFSCTKVLVIIVALLITLVYDHFQIKGPLFNADHLKGFSFFLQQDGLKDVFINLNEFCYYRSFFLQF